MCFRRSGLAPFLPVPFNGFARFRGLGLRVYKSGKMPELKAEWKRVKNRKGTGII